MTIRPRLTRDDSAPSIKNETQKIALGDTGAGMALPSPISAHEDQVISTERHLEEDFNSFDAQRGGRIAPVVKRHG